MTESARAISPLLQLHWVGVGGFSNSLDLVNIAQYGGILHSLHLTQSTPSMTVKSTGAARDAMLSKKKCSIEHALAEKPEPVMAFGLALPSCRERAISQVAGGAAFTPALYQD